MWAVRTQQAKWESLALPLLLTAHSLTSLVLDMKETKTMCGVQTFPTHTCTHARTHTNAHTQAHTRMPFLSALASQPLLSQQQSPPTQTHITGSPVPIFEPGSATSKVLFSPLHLETGLSLWVTPSLLHRLAILPPLWWERGRRVRKPCPSSPQP